MNLIRNTLLVVVLLQLLSFLYVKFSHQEEQTTLVKKVLKPPQKVVTLQRKKLPISTEYTDSTKTSLNTTTIALKKQTLPTIIVEPIIPTILTTPLLFTSLKCKEREKPLKDEKEIIKTYIKVKKRVKLTSKIEKYAKNMLGKKYVWGGIGPKTYDCSGFTQKVYRKVAGIKLPRVSYLQAKVGKKVAFKELKQGDMVFFDTEKKRTGRVNHVGIYLKQGNFIHASSGGKKIMITNFRKKRFYKNRFLWGRRVLKEKESIAMLPSNTKSPL